MNDPNNAVDPEGLAVAREIQKIVHPTEIILGGSRRGRDAPAGGRRSKTRTDRRQLSASTDPTGPCSESSGPASTTTCLKAIDKEHEVSPATKYAVRKLRARPPSPGGKETTAVVTVPHHYVEGPNPHPALFAADLTGVREEIKFLQSTEVGITKAAACRLLDHVRRHQPTMQVTMTLPFGYSNEEGRFLDVIALRVVTGEKRTAVPP